MLQQWGIISSSQQELVWTQPILSTDGTLGGNAFAVYSSYNLTESGYELYRSFTSDKSARNTNYSIIAAGGYGIIYNPDPINITNLHIVNRATADRAFLTGSIQGSNDNSTWTNIVNVNNTTGQGSGATWDINMSSNTGFYKYYKINVTTAESIYACFSYIGITATYQIAITNSITFPTSYTNTDYAFSLGFINENNTAYATNKTTTGMNLYNPSSSNGMANWYTVGY